MIAAIYARKSKEKEEAIARQVELARAFIAGRGWAVAEEHIYRQDDGISGAEFEDRPGLTKLMLAAKSTPRPFDVLVTMDQDRIGRDQRWTQAALHDLIEAGVGVYYYATGEELRLDTPVQEFMSAAKNFGNQWYRHQVRAKTREAMRAKAQHGHVAGGRVYGYQNVREGAHVRRTIIEDQAAIVRRIFQLAADGWGLVRIAKALTAEGVPKPEGRGRGWAPSAIRDMLRRDLYRGVLVYGKTRWKDRGGSTKVKVEVPESEWLVLEAPGLRIVPEALWQAVQASLEQKQAAYIRVAGGKLFGRPEGSRESPYLLTGLSVCSLCGGSIYATRRTSRGHERLYYGCFYHRSRGARACANGLTAPMDEVNRILLKKLERDVLTVAMVNGTIEDTVAAWRADKLPAAARREALEGRLRILEAEILNLTDALASGAALDSIRAALESRERERADVQAQLEHLDGMTRTAAMTDPTALSVEVARRLTDWQSLLERQPIQARQILRKLIEGRLLFEPFDDEERVGYRIRGQATYGRLLSGVVSVVPPG